MKKNSIENRTRVSEWMKERWGSGLPNGFKKGNKVNVGKKYSKERVDKIRQKQIGKVMSEESKHKMSLSHKGKRMPMETIKKIKDTFLKKSIDRVRTETKNNIIRKSIVYKNWRKSVFERDNYTCRDCCMKGGILNSHHVHEFASNPDKRFDVTNGITLCYLCHRKLHILRWASEKYRDTLFYINKYEPSIPKT